MPRSPTDATRFTSTGPHVATKPSSTSTAFSSNPNTTSPYGAAATSSGSQIQFGSAPPNETPQQKIARLRAAAQLAKQGKESNFDKTVRIGRIWADRAHRFTALGLIGLTVITGMIATAGITDMLLHNRRRRNEWLAEKQAETARDLAIAKQAEAQGIATEDQRLLINRERAAAEAVEAKKNRPGIFKRITNSLYGGLSEEEQKGGKLGSATASQIKSALDGPNGSSSTNAEGGQSILHAVQQNIDSHRRQGEMVQELIDPAGGPLDREAELVVKTASAKATSWTGWLTGR